MNTHLMSGLDGSNPLAFLAALGVLVALSEEAEGRQAPAPRLSWVFESVWRPRIHTDHADLDAIIEVLNSDRIACASEPALNFTYTKNGKAVPDVKASPAELRDTLLRWVSNSSPSSRRTLDWFTAFASEGATDNNGASKPTALHFYAGQQQFLKAALELAAGADSNDLLSALMGPWPYSSKLPVMGWDNTETRDYALRATDPSNDKKLGNPGADWLGLRGLELLPTAPRLGKQATPGVSGGWKNGRLTWPLWTVPLITSSVAAVMASKNLSKLTPIARERRGIGAVLAVSILRSDQGGYGSTTPAEVV